MNNSIIEKSKKVKLIVTDVDGVLTEGFVFINSTAEEPFGKFNILDGYAVIMARDCGIKTIVISGRKSLATEARCAKLGMDAYFTGVENKRAKLQEVVEQFGVSLDEVAYIGDDLIDIGALNVSGFSCAPANAVNDIKSRVDYVSNYSGGGGAFRDVVEFILKSQGLYEQVLFKHL